ncbi:MAG: hypothetical protein IPL61_07330 [Myxococcales bacterium]|nr:hypothetical protein [Myxococcales bacterium]
MSAHGEKKNPDKLNTVSIATVGFAGAAVVYLSIIGIEAIYLNESSRVDQTAQFGRQEETKKTLKAEQIGKITEPRLGPKAPNGTQLYVVPIDTAKQLVLRDVAVDPANLVPAVSRSEFTTIKPAFGRPQNLSAPQPIGHSAPPPVDPPVDPPAPADGATPAPADGVTPTPADGATPTPAAAPAPATTPTVPAASGSR